MKVIACYSIFNEDDFLHASLSTIHRFVDEIWIIDGPYQRFAHDAPHSTDRTLEIVKRWTEENEKVQLLASREWKDQIEKRNIYVEKMQEGDWMFIIDGDEIPWGNLHHLKPILAQEKAIIANVMVNFSPLTAPVVYPRLVRKIDGMHYTGSHAYIEYVGTNILADRRFNTNQLYAIFLIHLNAYRKKDRQDVKDYYYLFERPTEEAPPEEIQWKDTYLDPRLEKMSPDELAQAGLGHLAVKKRREREES